MKKIAKRIAAAFLCFLTLFSLLPPRLLAQRANAEGQKASGEVQDLEPEMNEYPIVSPVPGGSTVTMIVQAPRLETLQGKTVALVGGSFSASVTHAVIRDMLEEEFGCKTYYMDEIGRGGTYNPANPSAQSESFQARLKEYGVDAVISGNCGCGICTVKETGNALAAEVADGNLVPLIFVNGPVGRQIGVDHTQGMTTEEVNTALGRFAVLARINLAGLADGQGCSFGAVQPLVFSEDDGAALAAGWQPYHIQQGYGLNDSTVTVTSFSMWGNNVTPATDLPEEIMKIIAWDITEKNLGGLGGAGSEAYANTERTILITPSVAQALSALYKSKNALEGDLAETARRPMFMRAFAYYYADTDGVRSEGKTFVEVYRTLVEKETEGAELTEAPAWLEGITTPTLMTGAVMKPGSTRILVTGDSSRNKTQVMPGGCAVTVGIELPDAWDALMADMSYPSLQSCCLSDSSAGITAPIRVPSALGDGTYRILDPASGSKNLKEGRLCFDPVTATLYYNDPNTSVLLDQTDDAALICYLQNLGYNSSFSVSSGTVTDAVIRFSSNGKKPENNTVALTAAAFPNGLTLHANNKNSNAAGGLAVDGATVILSDTVTGFSVDLDGTPEGTDNAFVSRNGNSVTVNTAAEAGSTAIIGSRNTDGTYRTLTFVMGANNTYTVTYHTRDTLSVTDSDVLLKTDESTDGFRKTAVSGVYVLTKHFDAGQYRFAVSVDGTDLGNDTAFADCCDRLSLSAENYCTVQFHSSGSYIFRFDRRTNKLTLMPALAEPAPPPIRSASLVLNGSIDIAYAVKLPTNCTRPTMTFSGPNGMQTVTAYEQRDDLVYFTYTGITPQCMADTVTAVLYAEQDGEPVRLDSREYSVRAYCVNKLKDADISYELRTLLSDLLAYGAAAQVYTGYNAHTPVNIGSDITDPRYSTYSPLSCPMPCFDGDADDGVCWFAAGLTLHSSVTASFTFYAESTDGLTVNVTVNGRTQNYAAEDFSAVDGKPDTYRIFFSGITATELDDAVTASFLRGGNTVGERLTYRVTNYISAKQSDADEALASLVQALYNYGAAAKAYQQSDCDSLFRQHGGDLYGKV